MKNDWIKPTDKLVDGTLVKDWPDCAIDGCSNKCCVRLGSHFCYPHSLRPQDIALKQLDSMIENIQLEVVNESWT